jgi:hypothetical protein
LFAFDPASGKKVSVSIFTRLFIYCFSFMANKYNIIIT